MHAGPQLRRSRTTEVLSLDGVPGGTMGSFVPAISAAAVTYDPITWNIDPNLNLLNQAPDRFHLNDIVFDTDNTPHNAVTSKLADWILNHLLT
ncbi:hypothetical protein AB0I22_19400 [Streptomyces sp. NPDC050610]|uniref:hypothetical protein n=1 Tax=Streptomyces sp. NPDC050610 TaxID=3157097 RepID=UPI00342E7311